LGLLAAINDRVRWNVGPVPRCVDGEPHFYQWREGAVYYEVAGPADAPVLLLIHGINAAASSYELRRIFRPLAEHYRVYLPDLLGCGRSERPPVDYTSDTFVDLWCDFARDVIGRPAPVIASSLSCAHVIAAAGRHPERFGKLILICPTGVGSLTARPGVLGFLFHQFLRSPIVGMAFFNLLASRPSLAYYLRHQVYADPGAVTEAMVDDYFTVSHQPGARWVPASFLSAYLNRDVSRAFAGLPNPMHIVWGQEAQLTPVERVAAFRALRPDVPVDIFDRAGLLPHDEQPEEFVRLARSILG
jgi:pimeloyl-ACP methyl ester carboxylesterase